MEVGVQGGKEGPTKGVPTAAGILSGAERWRKQVHLAR